MVHAGTPPGIFINKLMSVTQNVSIPSKLLTQPVYPDFVEGLIKFTQTFYHKVYVLIQ